MSDDRRCPLCGSELTYERTERGIEKESVRCENDACRLPYLIWPIIVELLTTLEFAHGAIVDAIGCEDGLDGSTGDSVLVMIEEVLCSHKRLELVRTSVRERMNGEG